MIPVTLIALALIAVIRLRPALARETIGKILLFLALFILPILATIMGGYAHLENSKSTEFCLSCHVMTPYGKSLRLDDSESLPATHFQNRRIPRDHACFTCHTTYTMYGDFQAKLRGLKHVWVYYVTGTPEKIELYDEYQNRECLHCHQGARSFEENDLHEDRDISCLDCHSVTHEVDQLDGREFWRPPDE